jgi:hypothetical protein
MAEVGPAIESRRLTLTLAFRIHRSVPEAQPIGVQWYSAMRTALLAVGVVAVGLLAAWAVVDRRLDLPPVGPGVEQICAETMQRAAADLSWAAPNRDEIVRGREKDRNSW